MAKKSRTAPKAPAQGVRGPGRPTTIGATTTLILRLSPAMVEAIDKWSKARKVTRSAAARELIEAGLKRPPKV